MARQCLGLLLLLFAFSCESEPAAPLPIANFYADNAECASPCYVHFYDQSYSAARRQWDFGNSMSSDQVDDSVQYASPGAYNVTLTIWNADDVEDRITKQILVY